MHSTLVIHLLTFYTCFYNKIKHYFTHSCISTLILHLYAVIFFKWFYLNIKLGKKVEDYIQLISSVVIRYRNICKMCLCGTKERSIARRPNCIELIVFMEQDSIQHCMRTCVQLGIYCWEENSLGARVHESHTRRIALVGRTSARVSLKTHRTRWEHQCTSLTQDELHSLRAPVHESHSWRSADRAHKATCL